MNIFPQFKDRYLPYLYFYNKNSKEIDIPTEDEIADNYLSKFYIPQSEWSKYDTPKENIFYTKKVFPKMVFNLNYQNFIVSSEGGGVYEEKFYMLKNIMNHFKDEYFIIEHLPFLVYGDHLGLKLKFSSNISWQEFTNGSYISLAVEKAPLDDCFLIYGSSNKWGGLIISDFITDKNEHAESLDLIGFEKLGIEFFKSNFFISPSDKETVKKWLPKEYFEKWIYKE